MARLEIAGRVLEVAPLRLRELRAAAPFIDRIAARARGGGLGSVEAVAESAADMLGVIAAGVAGLDPQVLAADMALADLERLRAGFEQVLQEAGLTPGGDRPVGEAQTGEGGAASLAPSPPT
jgi:hypothetical protein